MTTIWHSDYKAPLHHQPRPLKEFLGILSRLRIYYEQGLQNIAEDYPPEDDPEDNPEDDPVDDPEDDPVDDPANDPEDVMIVAADIKHDVGDAEYARWEKSWTTICSQLLVQRQTSKNIMSNFESLLGVMAEADDIISMANYLNTKPNYSKMDAGDICLHILLGEFFDNPAVTAKIKKVYKK